MNPDLIRDIERSLIQNGYAHHVKPRRLMEKNREHLMKQRFYYKEHQGNPSTIHKFRGKGFDREKGGLSPRLLHRIVVGGGYPTIYFRTTGCEGWKLALKTLRHHGIDFVAYDRLREHVNVGRYVISVCRDVKRSYDILNKDYRIITTSR